MMSGNSLRPAVLSWRHHLLERAAHAGRARRRLLALLAGAVVGDFAGARFALDDGEPVAGLRRAGEAEHLDRNRRAGLVHRLAGVADQRAHAAPFGAGDDDVADMQRAALHQHGRHRAAAAVELGFDHGAFGGASRIGLEIEDFGLQPDHFEQPVEIRLLGRRDFDVEHVAAERFDLDLVLQQFGAHALGLGVRLVDLVDGDDHRHLRRLGVIDRLDRLRHHAVVGRDHQHDDVGDLGAARAHRGEGGVARRVDEGDLAARRRVDLIGADVLGDAAGFAAGHVGRADGVEQRGLAVVDVTHDGHDRRARHQRRRIVGDVEQAFLDVGFGDALDGVAEFLGDELGGVGVDHVVDLRHLALLHQQLDHVDRALGHAVGEFLDGDRLRNRDLADELFLRLVAVLLGAPALAAAERGHRALAHLVGGERGDEGEPAARLLAVSGARSAACGGAAGRTAPPAPRRNARRLFLVGFERRARAGRARRGRGLGLAEALLGDLVGLALGFLVVLAALVFLALAGSRRPRARPSRWPRGCARRSASSSAILRSSASRRRASPSAWARRLRSSSVSVRSTTPDGLGGGGAAGAAVAGAAQPRLGPRGGRRARLAAGAAGAAAAGAAASGLPSPPTTRRFLTSTTTCLLRPWLKLWRTTPVSARGLSDSVFAPTLSVFSPGVLVSAIPVLESCQFRTRRLAALARLAGPKALQARKTRQKRVACGPGKQGCMYHI